MLRALAHPCQRSRLRLERYDMREEEKRGPFTAYRWAKYPGSARIDHPAAGAPMHGVIDRGRSPAMGCPHVCRACQLCTSYVDADPIFRLVTDMWN